MNQPTTIVRPYRMADLNAVLAAWESGSRVGHPFLSEAFLAQERKAIAELYLPNAESWVAELDGKVVGFVSLTGNEVGGLFVDAAYHGMKIGKALMDKAQAVHGELEVEVFVANVIGRRFYARYGFVHLETTLNEATAQPVLRLKFTPTA